MITYMPSVEEYKQLLKEYKKIAEHLQVFTDTYEDPSFHMGKMSIINQLVEIMSNCGIEMSNEFCDTVAILQMFSAGEIARLIGDEGYKDVLGKLKCPLLATRDFVC